LQGALLDWAPAFVLVFARIAAAMAVLPGLGESVAPAPARIGLALGLTILLVPELQPLIPAMPDAGVAMGLMVAGEVITGLWFGWVARLITLALPIGAQITGYLIGLSSVLQPDPELGAQSSALGKMFQLGVPVVLLVSGLYRLPVLALNGLFQLIPPGQILPAADSMAVVIDAVGKSFSLALQLASPFAVLGIVWHLAVGQVARVSARMQIYFVSMPGQIMTGLVMLALTVSAIVLAWQDGVRVFFSALPGSG
jgi:flagellar biosynthesis protein FliR